MIPALTLDNAFSKIERSNSPISILVFGDLYHRSNRVGSTNDFLKNYYNHYDRISSSQLNFYWIGYGDYLSGVPKNDIPDVGNHGIHFEPDVYTKEFTKVINYTETMFNLYEVGLTFIILFDKPTSLKDFTTSSKIIINLSDPIFLGDNFREDFLNLLIEIANIIEGNYKYDTEEIESRINNFIKSQSTYYKGKKFIDNFMILFDYFK
ncbi:hypothetical protein [Erysipelothrix rhusiopathiae]|uniref:hypothetical protein n=1 Tax=Erysipelothrix rhusiopathiae TaxID=1648 RepID=UPI0024801FD7|nr:hypothetical protein [Erysipelothrix rhusiopathiae]